MLHRKAPLLAHVAGLAGLLPLLFAGPAAAYELLGASWDPDNGPIVYHLHPDGSDDIDDKSDLDAVRSAFRSWACVEGSRLRFLEADEDGPATADLQDGVNTFFWDESGQYMLGPGTLGVTLGDAPMSPDTPITRQTADIIMNGFDHDWRTDPADTGVDIESVAVHEIGHFVGLGHPCTDEAETDCLGPDQAVMTPQLPDGAIIRDLFDDDKDGLLEMYPQDEDDDSTCEGPFRQGEPCACNDECIEGLRCTVGEGQEVPVCTPNCGGNESVCPNGFSCVLAARPEGAENAEGSCIAHNDDGTRPPASVCERDSDCAEGLCLATSVVGRRICQTQCEGDDDCPEGYACTEDLCTGAGATEGLICPEPDPEPEEPAGPCNCAAPLDEVPAAAAGLLALPLAFVRRRTRRR